MLGGGGVKLSKITLGEKDIWENWKYKTTVISKSVSSSSGGWNEWYTWSSGWITLSKPIKNPNGRVNLSTRDTSNSKAIGKVRYADGTEATVASLEGGYHGSNESWNGGRDFSLTNDKEIVAYYIEGQHKKFSGSTTAEIRFNNYYQKG